MVTDPTLALNPWSQVIFLRFFCSAKVNILNPNLKPCFLLWDLHLGRLQIVFTEIYRLQCLCVQVGRFSVPAAVGGSREQRERPSSIFKANHLHVQRPRRAEVSRINHFNRCVFVAFFSCGLCAIQSSTCFPKLHCNATYGFTRK